MAVDTVNRIIRRAGSRVPPLTVAALGDSRVVQRTSCRPIGRCSARGQLRWTAVGIVQLRLRQHRLFPDFRAAAEGAGRSGRRRRLSFGVTSLVFAASIPGKGFTGYLMEVIGRRWTISYALLGSLPGLFLMLLAHRAGSYATVLMAAGALMTGFTALSAATVVPRLPVRAVPDGIARSRTFLRRVVRSDVFRAFWRRS